MGLCYGIIWWDILRHYMTELYYGLHYMMMLWNHITESFYGIILRDHIMELYYGITPWKGTRGPLGHPWSPIGSWGPPGPPGAHRGRHWDPTGDRRGAPWTRNGGTQQLNNIYIYI